MVTFDALPWDVVVLIEGSVGSPRDLHSLIAASPTALRAFNEARATVFKSIIQNIFPPLVLPHALAILQVPSIAHIPMDLSREERSAIAVEIVEPFLQDYFGNQADLGIPTDQGSVTKLFRLHSLVDRFIGEYVLFAARRIAENSDPDYQPSPSDFAPLSGNERVRFQRAFLRFELFCRVFPSRPEIQTFGVVEAEEQDRIFLRRLSPCDVEEMACVHNYQACLVAEVIDDLEERFVQAVLASPSVSGLSEARPYGRRFVRRHAQGIATWGCRSDGASAPVRRHHQFRHWRPPAVADDPVHELPRPGETFRNENDMRRWGMSLFSIESHWNMPTFIAVLASLGLAHTRSLAAGDDDQRRAAVQAAGTNGPTNHRRDHFFPAAHGRFLEQATLPQAPHDGHADDPSLPGPGYIRFHDSMFANEHIYDETDDLSYNPLREMAYVFWDSRRMEIPGVRRGLENGAAMDPARRRVMAERMQTMSRAGTVSLQVRLRTVEVPLWRAQDLVEQFGFAERAEDIREARACLASNQ